MTDAQAIENAPRKPSPPPMEVWLASVRAAVELRLQRFFDEERASVVALAPDAGLVLDGLESLTMRGGKRLRAAMMVAAQRAVAPEASIDAILSACAALEILQSYLLVHDDWMDGDDERRGGPAVHVLLRGTLAERGEGEAGRHLADSLAILAGDLGCAYANRLFLESASASPRLADALATFLRVQRDVVLGQTLDLLGSPDVARMHDLKTGSYTVEGPLLLGAILADAREDQLAVLRRVARPLGEAFQVRDDLLGTFGDPARTGKPVGNDLRAGKHNAVVAASRVSGSPAGRAALERVLGVKDAAEADVREAIALLDRDGTRAAVEAKLARLVEGAQASLDGSVLGSEGAARLRALAELLGARQA